MNNFNKKEKLIKGLILVIVIVLITIFLVFGKNLKYKNLEKNMLEKAQIYVEEKDLEIIGQTFISSDQLKLELPDNCNKLSGINIHSDNKGTTYYPYLICDDYMSDTLTITKGTYLKLLGANPYIVTDANSFVDPGYDLNEYIVLKTSNYQPTSGVYKITYQVLENDQEIERVERIIIVQRQNSDSLPTITLNGEKTITLKAGNEYIEPGFVAFDEFDGNITDQVVVETTLDINKPGNYEINYMITNSSGYKSIVSRNILVLAKDVKTYVVSNTLPIELTNEQVTISLKNFGSYAYTITPDKDKITASEFDYVVKENGKYIFEIYDTDGMMIEKEVLINNIDKTNPSGNCTIKVSEDMIIYQVESSDDSGIKGYSYFDGYSYSDYSLRKTAKYKAGNFEASVIIQDLAGNISKISCDEY